MDSTSAATPAPSTLTPKASKAKGDNKEKADKPTAPVRMTRNKEKFQMMKEKYDRVNGINEGYHRDLQNADERIRALQAENNLLLDSIQHMLANEPELSRQLRVTHEEDRRDKWIRDHPEAYQRIQDEQPSEPHPQEVPIHDTPP